jgi:hypothetical protein
MHGPKKAPESESNDRRVGDDKTSLKISGKQTTEEPRWSEHLVECAACAVTNARNVP